MKNTIKKLIGWVLVIGFCVIIILSIVATYGLYKAGIIIFISLFLAGILILGVHLITH